MIVRRLSLLVTLTCMSFIGCAQMREGMEGHQRAIARVDGFELTADHAAELIAAANERLVGTNPRTADPVAEVWVNHMMLASQLASPSSFDDVDVSKIAERDIGQQTVWKLHADAILSRAQPTEEETAAELAGAPPGVMVQARHIVIRVPATASDAAVDSLRRYAEELRRQVLNGADFADIAMRASQDPASAPAGGTLGWVSKGMLVPDLEGAIFSLEPGEISPLVRSPVGFHIIQTTDRRGISDEASRSTYVAQLRNRLVRQAEDAYIDSLFRVAAPRYVPGAGRRVRALAADPRTDRLSNAERSAPLASFSGGAVTVGEVADWIIVGAPNSRSTIGGLDDAGIVTNILAELVRNKLLIKAATDLGYSASAAQVDTLEDMARRNIYGAATLSGLRRADLTDDAAIEAAVDRVVSDILNGIRSPKGAERVRRALAQNRVVQFYPHRYPEVAEKAARIRAESASTAGSESGSE